MKSCPQCKVDYLDDTLEFCLEDGTRLIISKDTNPTNARTAVLNNLVNQPQSEFEISKEPFVKSKDTNKLTQIKEKATSQGIKIIEIAPIVLSLTHNYWQWLYLNKTTYPDTISFLTSIHFVIWLFLLIIGVIISVISLKYGKFKGFAVTGLVILAINLLVSIVPIK